MTFKAVIHTEPTGGYWGEVPALPGCYSQGETVDELMANLREAAIGCLEVLADEGRSPDPEVEVADLAL
jgi:predicted RNase H-like HicB family nuclease